MHDHSKWQTQQQVNKDFKTAKTKLLPKGEHCKLCSLHFVSEIFYVDVLRFYFLHKIKIFFTSLLYQLITSIVPVTNGRAPPCDFFL